MNIKHAVILSYRIVVWADFSNPSSLFGGINMQQEHCNFDGCKNRHDVHDNELLISN